MSDQRGTVCPLCGVGCRLEAGEGARARGVPGPANPNGRLCGQGVGAFDVGENRLTEPLVRRNGTLEPVSWETALDRATELLTGVRTRAGADGLGFLGAPHCTNEANYLLQKIARMLGTNNVDNRARLCHVSAARTLADSFGWPATTNSLSDVGDADIIVVAGANPARRQPVAFNSFVRPAVAEGTTLVHVDPVGNETTRLADYHIAPRPGCDATVFDLLSARLLATDGGVDEAFVADRTRGFDEFRASIADLDSEQARVDAGVSTETMADVAAELAAADRVAAMVGTGIEGDGPDASAALVDLLMVNGGVGRPGTGLFVLRGLANEQGATDAGCVPDRLPGYQPVTDAAARNHVAAEWGVTPPSTPGKNARELLGAFGRSVHGTLVVGENPAVSKRDEEWVKARLDALDALVVADVMPNSTTEHADVVLPAAAGVEKAGTLTNLERRIQRVQRGTTPPGDARTDRTILAALGARLTRDSTAFDYDGPGAVFEELTRVAPTHAGISFDDIDAGGRQWPVDSDSVLYRTTFDTPDGLAQFGTARPLPARDLTDDMRLVTGGRASEFAEDAPPALLGLAPADAARRGVDSGDTVLVTDGTVDLQVTVRVDEGTREGTAYLPAPVADPLLRSDGSTVTVRPLTVPSEEP